MTFIFDSILFALLLLGTFAEEVENEEYSLEDRDYRRLHATISAKVMHKIEKKIAQKIGLKEVKAKISFDKRIGRVQKKIKKMSTKIVGLQKRLDQYSKEKKQLKVLRMKILQKKRNIVLAIKKNKVAMKKKIAELEIKAMNSGKPAPVTQIKALELLQENQAKQLVRAVVREELANKIRLRHAQSKIQIMRRKIMNAKSVRSVLRNKLIAILKQKKDYMNKLMKKRVVLMKKAMRFFKVLAMFEKVKLSIKHLEQRLDVEVDEQKRQKFTRNIEYLNKKLASLKKRIAVLKRRKAERKARKVEIRKLKDQIKAYLKKYKADRKVKRVALRNAKRAVVVLKRAYKVAERRYQQAHNLEKRNKRGASLVGARKMYFATKRRIYYLRKELRMMKNISIEKVNAILRGVLKLKLIDYKMRITEHNLSIKEYEAYKQTVVKKLAVLRKYGKRLGSLCLRNRRLLKSQIKINIRRLRHVNRRIRHSQRAITVLNMKIGHVNRKFRMIAIQEYRHMKNNKHIVISIMKRLRREIRVYRAKAACAGVVTRKRMSFLIKGHKNELKVLKVELFALSSKIKSVDDAIREEKRQRLIVTKIDYHRAKAAFAETIAAIKKIAHRIEKNKEDATATDKIYVRKQLLSRNAIEAKKLVKLDAIKKRLEQRVKVLKIRYTKLVQDDLNTFLAYKAKWETRRDKVLAALKAIAIKERKLFMRLRSRRICPTIKCKLIFEKKSCYLKAHKLQIALFRINKKLEKIHAEYIRRGEAKSFGMIYKRFKKQRRIYLRVTLKLKHLRHQYTRLVKKIEAAEKRLPYLPDREKLVARAVVRSLEKIKRAVSAKIRAMEVKKVRVLKRYLAINKQYIIQLKKRITSDTKRKQQLIVERPTVLHAALYELVPRKQLHNERKLNRLDKKLEALADRINKDAHNLKEAIRTKAFLVEAIKPKVTCGGKKIIDCRYCKILGRLVKRSLLAREDDRVILERLTHRCNKELPNNQARCLDVAMRLTEVAVKSFDPVKFKVARACKQIGVCGI